MQTERILRVRDVTNRCGLSRSSAYAKAKDPDDVRCKLFEEGTRKDWEEECRVRCVKAWNKRQCIT